MRVSDLSRELGASVVTIRTDLDSLEQDGYLERVQGGAIQKARVNADWLGDGEPTGRGEAPDCGGGCQTSEGWQYPVYQFRNHYQTSGCGPEAA